MVFPDAGGAAYFATQGVQKVSELISELPVRSTIRVVASGEVLAVKRFAI